MTTQWALEPKKFCHFCLHSLSSYYSLFKVWPLHRQLLVQSFHSFLFVSAQKSTLPLYKQFIFPSLSHKGEHKPARQQLCTSQSFFPQTGPEGISASGSLSPLSAQGQNLHNGFVGIWELRALVNIPSCLLEFSWKSQHFLRMKCNLKYLVLFTGMWRYLSCKF